MTTPTAEKTTRIIDRAEELSTQAAAHSRQSEKWTRQVVRQPEPSAEVLGAWLGHSAAAMYAGALSAVLTMVARDEPELGDHLVGLVSAVLDGAEDDL